jgi:hypothetical protein
MLARHRSGTGADELLGEGFRDLAADAHPAPEDFPDRLDNSLAGLTLHPIAARARADAALRVKIS